jgi:hypothetical protein
VSALILTVLDPVEQAVNTIKRNPENNFMAVGMNFMEQLLERKRYLRQEACVINFNHKYISDGWWCKETGTYEFT